MEKKTGSLALIFLLIILLGTWWLLSVLQFGHASTSMMESASPVAYTVPQPIPIVHTFSGGMENYSGSLQLSDCQNLSTGVSASGENPAHVKLLFTVTTSGSCASTATSAAPFAIAVSAKKSNSTVLDAVMVNNEAATFSVETPQ